MSRVSSLVSRNSSYAREAALRLKCHQEGFELIEVSYYYKNGKKKKRVKKKKTSGSDCPRPQKKRICDAELTLDNQLPKLPRSDIPELRPKQETIDDIDRRLAAMQLQLKTPQNRRNFSIFSKASEPVLPEPHSKTKDAPKIIEASQYKSE